MCIVLINYGDMDVGLVFGRVFWGLRWMFFFLFRYFRRKVSLTFCLGFFGFFYRDFSRF